MASIKLRIEGNVFRDSQNREVTIRGINLDGSAKYPSRPDIPSNVSEGFYDGNDVSFVGRPFALDDAKTHFGKLKSWGYNQIRYIFTWEAIEHQGPGKYDEEWIDFTIEVLRLAKGYGFYIFLDPHQDVVCIAEYLFITPEANRSTVVKVLWRFWSTVMDIICPRIKPTKFQ